MLRRGQRFVMGGKQWRVASVSECRAHCVAVIKAPITVHDCRRGTERTFDATRRISIDISANSAVDVLADLERQRPAGKC